MSALVRCAPGALVLLILSACTSTSPPGRRIAQEAPPPPPGQTDASYDWHGLVLMPFGTLLKDSPIALHEVLLFHDDSHNAAEADNKDCFAIDGALPRFVGQAADQYLQCFDHDRSSRIEASVHLTAATAPQIFARACALWLKSTSATAIGTTCEGRDGGVAFSARLGLVPGELMAPLSITLTNAAAHESVHEPIPEPRSDVLHEK